VLIELKFCVRYVRQEASLHYIFVSAKSVHINSTCRSIFLTLSDDCFTAKALDPEGANPTTDEATRATRSNARVIMVGRKSVKIGGIRIHFFFSKM